MMMKQPIPQTEIKILNVDKRGSITAFAVEPPYPMPPESRYGIDPGTTNLGIATINPSGQAVTCYQIKMERQREALDRMVLAQRMLGCIYVQVDAVAIIEGASFGSYFRQVELAEIRAACALWFNKYGIDVKIIPPNSIRKAVFGSAKISNPWSNLPNDCAAALGCAYYPLNLLNISSNE